MKIVRNKKYSITAYRKSPIHNGIIENLLESIPSEITPRKAEK